MNILKIDMTDRIPAFLLKAARYVEKILMDNGFEAYLVGGSVRDLVLNRKISDLDFTTNAHPGQMKKIFPKTIPVGEEFGTILVLFHGHPVEVTTYRSDGQYKDGRRPDSVVFGHTLEEDVMRRDFTINGMAYQVSQKLLIDHVGGRKDIEAGIIRTIGNPMERFREDGLRPIRGCRMMANLGFTFDPETRSAMNRNIDIIGKVAPERFYDEWKKTLKVKSKHDYWNALKTSGIFHLFFPDFKQLNFNDAKWNNLTQAIEHSMPRKMGIYTAHFFYQEFCDEDKYAIGNVGALKDLMKIFFERNRFPVKTQKLCANLLTSPLLAACDQWQPLQDNTVLIKTALSKIDRSQWPHHLRFTKEILYRHYINAPILKRKSMKFHSIMNQIIKTMRDYRRKKFILYLVELNINGNDLLELGLNGIKIGNLLKTALDYVILYPEKNNIPDLKKYIESQI
jgi:tRNA nucleotidyltransferase/poly(A) polymerase